MALISEASPDEITSPFYKKNQEICLEWERIIEQHDGTINGAYNSWSYKVIGQIKKSLTWQIIVSKSTYSGTGYASLNRWNVFEDFILSTYIANPNSPEFKIRKKNLFDVFRPNAVRISSNNKYVIIGTQETVPFPKMVIDIISDPLEKNKINEVVFKENKLTISIPNYDEGLLFMLQLLEA